VNSSGMRIEAERKAFEKSERVCISLAALQHNMSARERMGMGMRMNEQVGGREGGRVCALFQWELCFTYVPIIPVERATTGLRERTGPEPRITFCPSFPVHILRRSPTPPLPPSSHPIHPPSFPPFPHLL